MPEKPDAIDSLSEPASHYRRRFLIEVTQAAAIVAAAGHGIVFAADKPTVESPTTFTTLNQTDATTLIVVARTLFPHDFIAEAFYADAVTHLDGAITKTPAAAEELRDVLRSLPGGFSELDTNKREQILGAHQDSAFFKQFRRLTINALYGNRKNWHHFGYTGRSLEFGGWVNRDLVDIDWLPKVT